MYPPHREINERGFAEYGTETDSYGTLFLLRQSSAVEDHVWLFADPNGGPVGILHLSPDNVRWLRERLGEYLDDIAQPRDVPHDCGLCEGPLRYLGDEDGIPAWECTACGWQHTSQDCCVPVGPTEAIDLIFDGPPGPEAGRFVEAEDGDGYSVRVGEWAEANGPDKGYWRLRIPVPTKDVGRRADFQNPKEGS
jgi:hypothetical protein